MQIPPSELPIGVYTIDFSITGNTYIQCTSVEDVQIYKSFAQVSKIYKQTFYNVMFTKTVHNYWRKRNKNHKIEV